MSIARHRMLELVVVLIEVSGVSVEGLKCADVVRAIASVVVVEVA
jgi:hypothetical protein